MAPILKMAGDYHNLLTYRIATVVYDITVSFTRRYLSTKDRTIDQMVQAARSGKQNIVEGNEAATTSRETQIKLTNVAKASLKELLADFEDYLRSHNLPMWNASHPRYERMRQYASNKQILSNYKQFIERMDDEEMANLAITMLHNLDALLLRQIRAQEEQFLQEGGIREKLSKARREYRGY